MKLKSELWGHDSWKNEYLPLAESEIGGMKSPFWSLMQKYVTRGM